MHSPHMPSASSNSTAAGVWLITCGWSVQFARCTHFDICHLHTQNRLIPHQPAPANNHPNCHTNHPNQPPNHPQLHAGYSLVHLMPRSASLVQAGGLNRMTLRGHTAGVRKVRFRVWCRAVAAPDAGVSSSCP